MVTRKSCLISSNKPQQCSRVTYRHISHLQHHYIRNSHLNTKQQAIRDTSLPVKSLQKHLHLLAIEHWRMSLQLRTCTTNQSKKMHNFSATLCWVRNVTVALLSLIKMRSPPLFYYSYFVVVVIKEIIQHFQMNGDGGARSHFFSLATTNQFHWIIY